MGYNADSPKITGGVIRRRAGNEPDGVLEEAALFSGLLNLVRDLDPKAARSIFLASTELIASYGYTTAQEGRSSPGRPRSCAASPPTRASTSSSIRTCSSTATTSWPMSRASTSIACGSPAPS